MSLRSSTHTRITAVLTTIAAAAVLLTGCSSGSVPPSTAAETAAKPVTPVTVAFGFLNNVQDSGLFVADDAGYYAKAGVKPTFVAGGGNAPAPEVAIASGQAQIGFESNMSRLFEYLSKADDIVIIGQVFQKPPNGLLSLKARPVRNEKELEGAKIMGAASNKSFVEGFMTINGVTDYTFVPGGADIGALQAGRGDAMLAFASNQPIVLEKQGLKANEDFFFTPFDELNYHLMAGVIIVSKSFLAEHRDAVVGFLKASAQGWEKAIEDPRAAADLTVNKYVANQGLDVEKEEASLKAQIPLMTSPSTKANGLFTIDPNIVKTKVYPGLEAAGLTNLPDVSKAIDMSPLEEAQR